MPPKKEQQKKVNKLVEDKTFVCYGAIGILWIPHNLDNKTMQEFLNPALFLSFLCCYFYQGLKNKNKSKKVQEFIHTVEKSAKNSAGLNDLDDDRAKFKAKKEAEKRQAEEDFLMGGGSQYNKLKKQAEKEAREKRKLEEEQAALAAAKPVEEIDPSTILCQDFMKGICMLGENCKYSHDDAKARKSAKLSLYQDAREKAPGFRFTTEKVCPHFLDAVEHSKFGHFWVCPNGGDKCVYRHCLPFGYVIKREIKKDGEEIEELDIAEQIEIERRRLDISKCTPVTEERLKEWMVNRKKQLDAEVEAQRAEQLKKSGNKGSQHLSGRSLFQLDPSLFKDDDNAADDSELIVEVKDLQDLEETQDIGIEEDTDMGLDDIDVEVDTSLFE